MFMQFVLMRKHVCHRPGCSSSFSTDISRTGAGVCGRGLIGLQTGIFSVTGPWSWSSSGDRYTGLRRGAASWWRPSARSPRGGVEEERNYDRTE
uniref:Uncharacterized protein n=1 Tax=Knipowitschia caucasica TaxID=637954 RepID=A0AAV2KFG9_KNICA